MLYSVSYYSRSISIYYVKAVRLCDCKGGRYMIIRGAIPVDGNSIVEIDKAIIGTELRRDEIN
jgi:hypothetical protein